MGPLIVFLILPIAEIVTILQVGRVIGTLPTVALLVLAMLLGVWLIRVRGLMSLAEIQRSLAEFRDPTPSAAGGAFAVLAGVLLVLPGFLSDIAGLALLAPPVQAALVRHLKGKIQSRAPGRSRGEGGTVIDGEFREIDPPPLPGDGKSGWTRH